MYIKAFYNTHYCIPQKKETTTVSYNRKNNDTGHSQVNA